MQLYNAGYHDKTTTPEALTEMIRLTAPTIKLRLADEKAIGHNITHIAATGTSGLSAAFALSTTIRLPVVVVRRNGEQAHSGNVIGTGNLGDYIIIDDLISSGRTINHIVTRLRGAYIHSLLDRAPYPYADIDPAAAIQAAGPQPICRAIFLYRESGLRGARTPNILTGTDYDISPLGAPLSQRHLCEEIEKRLPPHPPIPVITTEKE